MGQCLCWQLFHSVGQLQPWTGPNHAKFQYEKAAYMLFLTTNLCVVPVLVLARSDFHVTSLQQVSSRKLGSGCRKKQPGCGLC